MGSFDVDDEVEDMEEIEFETGDAIIAKTEEGNIFRFDTDGVVEDRG